MPEGRTISVPTYTRVCIVLVLLTMLTVSGSFLPLKGAGHVVIGLAIALVKASLVVLFFMHALLSDRVTWAVIAVASFWVGMLTVLTLCDYFTREVIPHMPGH